MTWGKTRQCWSVRATGGAETNAREGQKKTQRTTTTTTTKRNAGETSKKIVCAPESVSSFHHCTFTQFPCRHCGDETHLKKQNYAFKLGDIYIYFFFLMLFTQMITKQSLPLRKAKSCLSMKFYFNLRDRMCVISPLASGGRQKKSAAWVGPA